MARSRLGSHWGEPLFIGSWLRVLMIHLEVEANGLQSVVPYELDCYEGHAFVTLVAFTLENMRLRRGGKLGAWLLRPIATHDFLNVRTYVRHRGEPGIHFLAEWLSNRLAVALGPATFGLPYRFGKIAYEHDHRAGQLQGNVTSPRTRGMFAYQAVLDADSEFTPCAPGSRDEWLMERYTAFNSAGRGRRFFRVWHPPWPQTAVPASISDLSLLTAHWPMFATARIAGANYSPGLPDVWMGRPHPSE